METNMNKIRTFIIHALGGYTKNEYLKHEALSFGAGQQSVTESLMYEAERLYGKPADEWAEKMYRLIKELDKISRRNETDNSTSNQ